MRLKDRGRHLRHPKPSCSVMGDSIFIPQSLNRAEAIRYIIKIASDKGSHVLTNEALDWAELKLLAIKQIAKRIS
jgi:hypothetical protein